MFRKYPLVSRLLTSSNELSYSVYFQRYELDFRRSYA